MTSGSPPPGVGGFRGVVEGLQQLWALRHAPERLDVLVHEQRELANLVARELHAIRFELGVLQRTHNALATARALPPESTWSEVLPARAVAEPPSLGAALVFPYSALCRQEDMDDPVILYWLRRLGQAPAYHRKQWEFGFLCQVLHERGALAPSSRGLGFGVGEEPLSALFASYGCHVMGTDQAVDQAVASGWTATHEHAAGKAALSRPDICDPAVFEASVEFEAADMNAIPQHLRGFDFCWAACALEHLGSLEHGLTFIERSLDPLKPGGLAVHTTEFNLSSNADTMDHNPTVLFRRRDLEALAARLTAAGHHIAPFD
ncbi:hypothetical protein BH09PSE2_BH09PSE2_06700 [soil metagenome]